MHNTQSELIYPVLLVVLDAFSKATSNRCKASEKLPGERRSFQYIQETRPSERLHLIFRARARGSPR